MGPESKGGKQWEARGEGGREGRLQRRGSASAFWANKAVQRAQSRCCLLYTSDAADDTPCVDL
eukprot:4431374-Pleurochrysis_carterae.AAC.1